ncbi:MAG TPA: CoA ester lyase [Candidatus Didemnitutus sp.]
MSAVPPRITALLFTPGNRPDRFPKAAVSGADGIIVDWEDAVAAGDKDATRRMVLDWLAKNGRLAAAPFLTGIRINDLRSAAGLADLEALPTGPVVDFVMLPKVQSPAEVQQAAESLPAATSLIALVETVRGIRAVHEIAAASPRLLALGFGGLDLSAETGGEPVWDALLWPRTQLVHACAAAGIAALDQPFIDYRDGPGLASECARVRSLGFAGKLAIHPGQCAAIVAAFQPSVEEASLARRIVAAADEARGGVVALDGRMIDAPLVHSARRTLQRIRS